MRDNGLTHIGNYNKNKFDRTKWYALSDEIISFYRQDGNSQTAECQTAKQQNEKQPNGRMSNSQTAEPIPDNIPNTIPDSKPDISSSAQPPGERFAEDSDEMKLCLLLAERMRQNKPDCKLPGNFQDWCRHVDLMIRIDGRTPKQIQDVIVFCQKDAFWQSNILSTKKLREKFDQLSMKMRSPAAKKPQQGGNPFLRKLERDGAI